LARLAIASGAKGLTALVVVSLIEQGVLDLFSTARPVLRDDLPLIDDRMTVEMLLAHRSGIGDYLDEDDGSLDVNDYLLPVRGVGDGGAYTTVADLSTFWRALFAGKIVPARWVAEMVRPRNDVPGEPMRCGLGFFLHESRDQVMLIWQDAGVSFMSVHDPAPGLTYTVISNTADGAWPVLRHLRERFSA
jgi:CubicO group peptidase (beta-lactamase class C family)